MTALLSPLDVSIRSFTAFDLEAALVRFLSRLFLGSRLDNPTLNLGQAGLTPIVPFDYTERARTLELKQAPRIVRGRIPRTVTGEIAVDKLPDVPSVIVQAINAKVEQPSTFVTVRKLFVTYDENPDSHGYQDVLNMLEAASLALTSFGQAGIEEAYVIVLPLEWKVVEADAFPHFLGEMTTMWELPSGRPMPDLEHGIIPAEQLDIRVTYQEDLAL